jgi:hypothetical protein
VPVESRPTTHTASRDLILDPVHTEDMHFDDTPMNMKANVQGGGGDKRCDSVLLAFLSLSRQTLPQQLKSVYCRLLPHNF